jgi:hypothetical protein
MRDGFDLDSSSRTAVVNVGDRRRLNEIWKWQRR